MTPNHCVRIDSRSGTATRFSDWATSELFLSFISRLLAAICDSLAVWPYASYLGFLNDIVCYAFWLQRANGRSHVMDASSRQLWHAASEFKAFKLIGIRIHQHLSLNPNTKLSSHHQLHCETTVLAPNYQTVSLSMPRKKPRVYMDEAAEPSKKLSKRKGGVGLLSGLLHIPMDVIFEVLVLYFEDMGYLHSYILLSRYSGT